jgi:N-glycosylase/DNA lyase
MGKSDLRGIGKVIMGVAISLTHRYEKTIKALCLVIESRINICETGNLTECDLRRELAGCILGSQVRYEMAQSAVDIIEKLGLFEDTYWMNYKYDLESLIYNALTNTISYRFPRIRAQQLNETKRRLLDSGLSLKNLVFELEDEKDVRRNLITMIPGLGPKQASMFLRNVNRSYNLAVIDTHVLRYLEILQITNNVKQSVGQISTYERIESLIRDYSKTIGYPVGYMDWAIWATMRAAGELGL